MTDGPTIAILGGSLTGNKGAASMLLAVIDGIRARSSEAEVRVFSPYPAEDSLQSFEGQVVEFTPKDMLVSYLPAAGLALLSFRKWRPSRGRAAVLASSDVAADVSGIAFMDGRGIATLAYNVLLVLIPWAFGVPVVKMAQALGPFKQPLNRFAARFTLTRVEWIGLRGAETARNVGTLQLRNAEPAPDVAFLLEVDSEADLAASVDIPDNRRITLMAPSAVIDERCREVGIDYADRMSQLVNELTKAGHHVVLIAHSAREGAAGGHTNDLPVCRRIAGSSAGTLLDREIDARQLRAMIGRARLLVTSRFHAMISGLATGTPTFVVGWSHKYVEVLSEFDLQEWAVDFRDARDEALLTAILMLDEESEKVRAKIAAHLPQVRAEAEHNLDQLMKVLAGH